MMMMMMKEAMVDLEDMGAMEVEPKWLMVILEKQMVLLEATSMTATKMTMTMMMTLRRSLKKRRKSDNWDWHEMLFKVGVGIA